MSAGAAYNPAKYAGTFLVGCNSTQTPGVGTCSVNGTTAPVDQLAGTSLWRVLLNGEYAHNLNSYLVGFVQSDLTFESEKFQSATPGPYNVVPDIWSLGGRVGIRSADGHWGVSLFGRNLLDQHVHLVIPDVLGGFDGGAGLSYWTTPPTGVAWGVTLDARF
jgi:iron complex outermembrane receptor protein